LLMELCKQIRDHSVLKDKLSPEEWGEPLACLQTLPQMLRH